MFGTGWWKRTFMNPIHGVYLLAHVVLFLGGFLLWQHHSLLWRSVGASLVAAGVAGWVVFVYVMASNETKAALKVLTEFGITDAFDRRATRIKPEYDKRLARARQRIDVLGFGLSAMREDYYQELHIWAQKAPVRILLLDPDFPATDLSFADQRDAEERDVRGKIRTDVKRFVADVRNLLKTNTRYTFEIRLYTCLPSLNIFRVDDEMLWGPYLVKTLGRNTPTFVAKQGGVFFNQLANHFEQIWRDENLSRPVPQAWLHDDDEKRGAE